MTKTEIQIIANDLLSRGLTKPAINFLLVDSAGNHDEFPKWVSENPDIPDLTHALVLYWASEFDWCTSNPIWESDYSELEYSYIQSLLNAFPGLYRGTSPNIGFN